MAACEFVEVLPEELTCSICMKVLREPHLVNCCEQQFCKGCLEKWLKGKKSCPRCHSEDFSTIHLKQKSKKIGELKVYCPNKQDGCKAELKISECDEHLSTANNRGCLYVKLDCSTCSAKVFRGRMKAHRQTVCPKRLVRCVHCKTLGEHQLIVGDHTKICSSYPLICPQGCGTRVLRKYLNSHHSDCPLEPVLCPFNGLGCKTKVCRKDLNEHIVTSMVQHLTELTKSHMTLQAAHTSLQAEHTALKESYTAKLQAIGQVLTNAPSVQSSHQIYAILSDISTVTVGGSISLGLSDSNITSGHHYILLSQNPPKPNYKFKLEWEMDKKENVRATPQQKYLFRFFLVVNEVYPVMAAEAKLDVRIQLDVNQTMVKICCKKPRNEGSLQLIATSTLKFHQSPKLLKLYFNAHDHCFSFCPCPCHHFCKGCDFTCDNTTPDHTCHKCGVLCNRHHCYSCGNECDNPVRSHYCDYCGEICD